MPSVDTQFKPDQNLVHTSGMEFGLLMTTGKSYIRDRRRILECICGCGKLCYILFQSLKSGGARSCGCNIGASGGEKRKKHGFAVRGCQHPLYSIWMGIKNRCNYSTSISYSNYGGRGIGICSEWENDFDTFIKWAISNGWKKGLTIERKDVDVGYSPENCKWATYHEQSRNKRTNRFVSALGEIKCFKDWSLDSRCMVSYTALRYRMFNLKWPPEMAITTPPNKK